MTMRFTESSIKKLTHTPGDQVVVWDDELPGFGVRISQAGAKSYFVKYRLKTGQVRWKVLGRTTVLTLIEARAHAKRDLGLVADDKDPMTTRDKQREALSVADVAAEFITQKTTCRSPRTIRSYQQILDAEILPRLRTRALADVDPQTVTTLHYQLRKTPVLANRTIDVLSSMIGWSMKRGLIPLAVNPCKAVEDNPETGRDKPLTDGQLNELKRAMKAHEVARGQQVAIELFLTVAGMRPISICSLRWDCITFRPNGTGQVELPAHKTARRTGPQYFELSKQAVNLLRSWPRHARSPFVFPGNGRRDKSPHMSPSTLSHTFAKVREGTSFADRWLYDLRHTNATHARSKLGMPLSDIGDQLGHKNISTTKRYAHVHQPVQAATAGRLQASINRAFHGGRSRR